MRSSITLYQETGTVRCTSVEEEMNNGQEIRSCDVCKGTAPQPTWVQVDLVYKRGRVESHEHLDYCSLSCYLVDLVSQFNLVRDQIREESSRS